MHSTLKVRDFIRKIRSARTAADERAAIQVECAHIRCLFREANKHWRCRNVAKLIYIHILGYPTHFGQMECLKLIASSKFTDKRIGYLGSMLLLDERQDVHLLMTNSLKLDLNNQTQFVAGWALCTIGVICSSEINRDLAGDVVKLLKSPNSYLKKKAALCAFRMIKKTPELMEMFIPATRSLLSEKNHGVLASALVLITEMCEKCPDVLNHFQKLIPKLVRSLKNFIMSYSAEHDFYGVRDPFLQVKFIRLLRLLGRNDPDASESMVDVLALVATNTETNRNVGNAIIYETVLTILDIKSGTSLRTLGVNVLGRFLSNVDKNIKYVALNTLLCVVEIDYNAVKRHQSSIIECLEDPDTSIKKRAMELCFALINTHNIDYMTKKLLIFLKMVDFDIKSQCSSNLFISAEKYAPSKQWYIDSMIEVLALAGNYVMHDAVSNLIQIISESTALHAYTVQRVWKQLTSDLKSKQPLVQVASWCVGEFGDLLNSSKDQNDSTDIVTPDYLIGLLENVAMNMRMNLTTKEFSITALMKLAARFPTTAARVKKLLDVFCTNVNIELQQRTVEFSSLFSKYNYLLPSLLERMPAMENKNLLNCNTTIQNGKGDLLNVSTIESERNFKHIENSEMLIDLLSDSPDTPSQTESPGSQIKFQSAGLDLLGLFDDLKLDTHTSNACPLDTLNISLNQCNEAPQSNVDRSLSVTAFERNGLKVSLKFDSQFSLPRMIKVILIASNYSSTPISKFLFQVAVPKNFQLQLFPPTNNTIPAHSGSQIQQTLKIFNPTQSQLMMKLRITYISNGCTVLEEVELKDIPII